MSLRTLFGMALTAGLIIAAGHPAAGRDDPDDDDIIPPPAATAKTKPAADNLPSGPEKKYPDFATVVKGAKEFDGLFKLHLKDDHLYAEILPHQFDRPYMFAAAIAKGAGVGGTTLIGDEAWVLYFKKVGEKVFLCRKNTRFQAKAGTPAWKATDTTYSDSVLLALPIKTVNPMKGSTVLDLNQVFFSDFAELGVGMLDQSRTTWHKVKAFKKNIELQVAATFAGNRFMAGDDVIDNRGLSLVLHYSLIELPEFGYTPRAADDRVGHFISVVKDFTDAEAKETAFVRYVNRWRLERADGSPWKPGAKLQPPKKKIVFWIENSVPDEFRAAVREGILEWNKAFEKIGFRDAIEVRQQEGEDFDPEDITYATFRWVTNEQAFAIGPSRVNPLTGEIMDADILFDASMVRYEKANYRAVRSAKGETFEPASEIEAARRGWLLPTDPLARLRGWNDRAKAAKAEDEADPEAALTRRLHALRHGYCQCASHKTSELALAAIHRIVVAPKDGEKVPEELLQQAVKETVMHEVGHTLGLRHNFKASTMVPNEKLHDTAVTAKGLVGSVMDYNPANIAPKGVSQGHYFTPTIGPYDYWAIEYAYAPVGDDELKKVAAKAADPKLTYATDEDLFATADPLVNQWDLGGDPLKFAQERIRVAQDLLPKLADAVIDSGEGYQRTRLAFQRLLGQYGNAAVLAGNFVGGEAMYRDHKGDPNARDPFVPVAAAKQREALKFLQEAVLTDKPFEFPPELLRKLAADRWLHWGNEGSFRRVDFDLNARVLGIQRVALRSLFDPAALKRVQENALKAKKDEQPLTLAEVFRAATDSSFADLPAGGSAAAKSSVIRRNLQRAYLTRLGEMVLGPKAVSFGSFSFTSTPVPADARSLARKHLKEIGGRIDTALKTDADAVKGPNGKPLDETTRAHLEEAREQIAKVLSASLTANEP